MNIFLKKNPLGIILSPPPVLPLSSSFALPHTIRERKEGRRERGEKKEERREERETGRTQDPFSSFLLPLSSISFFFTSHNNRNEGRREGIERA